MLGSEAMCRKVRVRSGAVAADPARRVPGGDRRGRARSHRYASAKAGLKASLLGRPADRQSSGRVAGARAHARAITVVQPTLALSQLVLLGVARLTLHERVARSELIPGVGIPGGLTVVLLASPRGSLVRSDASGVVTPLAITGNAAVTSCLVGRWQERGAIVPGGGRRSVLRVADFASKLAANRSRTAPGQSASLDSRGRGDRRAAILEENTALQRSPAVTVAPVIGAMKPPLPVLMALWAGVESCPTGAPARPGSPLSSSG